ncbi:hypothetical protein J4G48_0040400 [Bradyrhizobium barranii subsp. apii]|uniref:hypothetical protein n=1 Tax=Bradyrhizobium barranii TaxID=2992140 RepID=UPI001AA113A1|nr:hypothetical protein [Bradyrhizobium barranii]UPT95419.1 hypothetical protein J4G48_0040400 [Bradyrhizobium barranii subsp. apii]
MPELTRRRHNDPQRQGWDVYYGDVRVGHIGERAGVPKIVDQWGWTCGFYPGCDPGEQQHGIGATFEDARAGFDAAWKRMLPKKTEAHFEMWRYQRDADAWKRRMWDEKCRMPSQREDGQSNCFCGEPITNRSVPEHIRKAHRGIGNDSHSVRRRPTFGRE